MTEIWSNSEKTFSGIIKLGTGKIAGKIPRIWRTLINTQWINKIVWIHVKTVVPSTIAQVSATKISNILIDNNELFVVGPASRQSRQVRWMATYLYVLVQRLQLTFCVCTIEWQYDFNLFIQQDINLDTLALQNAISLLFY